MKTQQGINTKQQETIDCLHRRIIRQNHEIIEERSEQIEGTNSVIYSVEHVMSGLNPDGLVYLTMRHYDIYTIGRNGAIRREKRAY